MKMRLDSLEPSSRQPESGNKNKNTEQGPTYLDFALLALGAAVSALVMRASRLCSWLCHR
jgi:hypothetical protein